MRTLLLVTTTPTEDMASSGAARRGLLLRRLRTNLGRDFITSRRGAGGRLFHYVIAHDVFAIANALFGNDCWSNEILSSSVIVNEHSGDMHNVSLVCEMKVTVSWPWGSTSSHSNVGYGHGQNRQLGQAHESAGKEAYTDALKRALFIFGNAVGLCLYDAAFLENINRLPAQQRRTLDVPVFSHNSLAEAEQESSLSLASEQDADLEPTDTAAPVSGRDHSPEPPQQRTVCDISLPRALRQSTRRLPPRMSARHRTPAQPAQPVVLSDDFSQLSAFE